MRDIQEMIHTYEELKESLIRYKKISKDCPYLVTYLKAQVCMIDMFITDLKKLELKE